MRARVLERTMPPRSFTVNKITDPPAPLPAQPFKDLVKPTYAQIATAKAHIVGLASHRDYVQSHIDALEADLKSLDPADVAKVVIEGYPLKK